MKELRFYLTSPEVSALRIYTLAKKKKIKYSPSGQSRRQEREM